MAVNTYRKFRISIDEQSKKTQGLHVGDIVRRQYFDDPNLIYSLMCVLKTGFDTVQVESNGKTESKKRQWFIGALLDGDEPRDGEILDFVRITNLWDANRLGAMYLTADDEQSPYMDVIDGIPVEQSLCYPSSINNVDWEDGFSQYTLVGKAYATATYTRSYLDNNRICTIKRNSVATPDTTFIGLSQLINKKLSNPDRVLISYKIKANRVMDAIMTLGYEDGTRLDGTVTVPISTDWEYKLQVITVENAERYKRVLKLNFNDSLKENDEISIADFNMVLFSSVSNFAGGMKVRIGKLDGVSDPVFGTLEDYGVYAQRFYASDQVNISGTLTAGDENGFGSTFYAGRIHKNVLINSVACDFDTTTQIDTTMDNPVGIGEVYKLNSKAVINVQTNAWMLERLGRQYCYSCWLKSETECFVKIDQNGFSIKSLTIVGDSAWHRYAVPFEIQKAATKDEALKIAITPSKGTVYMAASQLEKGRRATQYQPTDDVLSYVEDYGAWFNKGGIGGTIQNPLLRLNEDGSISSKNNSFVINNDGTGHFANGRFKWSFNEIVLQDVTIKWENLSPDTQETLKPKSIHIIGENAFMEENEVYSPSSIKLEINEINFTSSSSQRKWYYYNDTEYVLFAGENGRQLVITPDGDYWGDRSTLTIKCVVTVNSVEYIDTITIHRGVRGENVYTVQISSSNGTILKNGVGGTILTAAVFCGNLDITSRLLPADFNWIRKSSDETSDAAFNKEHEAFGNVLEMNAQDLSSTVTFDCCVNS